MIYVYLFSILIARVVQAIFSKRSSNEVDNIALTVKYTAYKCAVSAGFGLILLLTDISNIGFDLPTVSIAALSGVSLFFSTFFSIYGMKSGTVSLVSMFGTAGLPTALVMGKTEKYKGENIKLGKTLYICGIALAAAVFVINQFATTLTALLPPVFLFTFINGGGTIISTLVAAVMYKEKLSVYSILGVIIGIGSMIMIKMF